MGNHRGHEFVDAGVLPSVHEPGQRLGEVALRIDGVELAGLNERGHDSPVLRAVVAACEPTVLA